MSKIRIRCQVLDVITLINRGTAEAVAGHLPHLKPVQVQKTLVRLCEADEIRIVGKEAKKHSGGKPWNIYRIRDENTPIDTSKKKVYKKTGRKTHSQELQRPATRVGPGHLLTIRYRDRKIQLFERLLPTVHGADRDLLVGCINDYKA